MNVNTTRRIPVCVTQPARRCEFESEPGWRTLQGWTQWHRPLEYNWHLGKSKTSLYCRCGLWTSSVRQNGCMYRLPAFQWLHPRPLREMTLMYRLDSVQRLVGSASGWDSLLFVAQLQLPGTARLCEITSAEPRPSRYKACPLTWRTISCPVFFFFFYFLTSFLRKTFFISRICFICHMLWCAAVDWHNIDKGNK